MDRIIRKPPPIASGWASVGATRSSGAAASRAPAARVGSYSGSSVLVPMLIDLLPAIEIMDIGASYLESEGLTRFYDLVESGVAHLTGFEPAPEQYEKLRAKFAGDARYRFLPNALGTGSPATFHIARYPGCSSLYRANPAMIDLFHSLDASSPGGNFTVVGTVTIETSRLDDLPVPRPDLIKLDIQGGELDVLRYAHRTVGSALVAECECEFVEIYKGNPCSAISITTFASTVSCCTRWWTSVAAVFAPCHCLNRRGRSARCSGAMASSCATSPNWSATRMRISSRLP
jgi:FkbM family methyltransferase